MMYTAKDYTIYVGIDRETGDFVAITREFPSLSWVAFSRPHAAQGLRGLLAEVLEDIYEDGGQPPAPAGRSARGAEADSLRELASA